MLHVFKEVVIILLTAGITTLSQTQLLYRRLLFFGVLGFILVVYIETKIKHVTVFNILRDYLVPVGLSLLFHAWMLYVQEQGTPLEIAMYAVFGWVLVVTYYMTWPFTRDK
ncbi:MULTISPECIES: hypothetical protein [Vibrio]|uniref:hypothetical protein n=1 Tax=Vibrio TaxID=662 RepID=UPI001E63440F|nr:hypothetical protein [Vibrio lentus]MCC4837988.1 hypothetical protein [Vibrio lentus]